MALAPLRVARQRAVVTRCVVKHSPFRFYDVRVGDAGAALEVRFRGRDLEAWLLRIDRTGEEHWFLAWELEEV